jgi:catechol 2,3-dioxygenase-like lactoylglutathione lyase family enzyme
MQNVFAQEGAVVLGIQSDTPNIFIYQSRNTDKFINSYPVKLKINNMNLEHTALNVPQPKELVAWYQKNLGLKLVFEMDEAPFMHFLADDKGSMLEIYHNDKADIPDYQSQHPLILHLAFVSEDPVKDRERLENAGASFFEEQQLPSGIHLIMMRDPWGIPIQLCKRTKPLV